MLGEEYGKDADGEDKNELLNLDRVLEHCNLKDMAGINQVRDMP